MLRTLAANRPLLRATLRSARYATTSAPAQQEKRVYVIAGEASGDAIGAKVIAALQRQAAASSTEGHRLKLRGIGGSQMMSRGGFESLFPMEELSVMGLVEVLPSVLRLRRRLADTIEDIRAFRPHVLLTIDSKGFTFRVQRALAGDDQLRDTVKRMHYVAPSVWAYKHRKRKSNYDDLKALLDALFVILPFEKRIFDAADSAWCKFVGHPTVEDFLEFYGKYDHQTEDTALDMEAVQAVALDISPGGLLEVPVAEDSSAVLTRRAAMIETLRLHRQDDRDWRAAYRLDRGLPFNAFLVCALVGSREHEVRRTIRTVLDAVDTLHRPAERLVNTSFGVPMKLAPLSSGGCVVKRPIHVVFPTIQALEVSVRHEIQAFCDATGASPEAFSVTVDATSSDRIELFQAADAAVAVSGTIVMETTLAALPTVVIYRANRITEMLAKQLSAVEFVSIPNLLLGREEIPELLFRDCNAPNISKALRAIYSKPKPIVSCPASDPSQLAMALGRLTPWNDDASATPRRGSDLVADTIWRELTRN